MGDNPGSCHEADTSSWHHPPNPSLPPCFPNRRTQVVIYRPDSPLAQSWREEEAAVAEREPRLQPQAAENEKGKEAERSGEGKFIQRAPPPYKGQGLAAATQVRHWPVVLGCVSSHLSPLPAFLSAFVERPASYGAVLDAVASEQSRRQPEALRALTFWSRVNQHMIENEG
ncbi:hypothetical protein GBF38_018130, partial [Nibea albiflora]